MKSTDIILVLGDEGVGKTACVTRLKMLFDGIECFEGTHGAGMLAMTAKQPSYVVVMFDWSNPLTYPTSKRWIEYARKNFDVGVILLFGTKRNDEIISQTSLGRYYLSTFHFTKISELHSTLGWKFAFENDVYYHTIDATSLSDIAQITLCY